MTGDLKALATKRLSMALSPLVEKVIADHLPNAEIFHAALLVARASDRFHEARQARMDFAGNRKNDEIVLVNNERKYRKQLEANCRHLQAVMLKHGRMSPNEAEADKT